jgi:hypothetical protein
MKVLQIELPDALADEVEMAVSLGFLPIIARWW